ncbi:recombinase family protein [Bacillus cereus]|uniref:recombinase family protein n=1 Tax=Bacillus cereus TaxID=1396 RepID=UPI001427A263|nr:recombinase family protein [Bacillus cereus]NIL13275.1 recombinase family protein [Bacillus cereus]NKW75903.1 recombinase family protein [Bacillus cereus]HDR6477500.1 recombinase family protein [Bacillus cereus]HDR8132905.1 recombinase family protein [Bacillus cereus]
MKKTIAYYRSSTDLQENSIEMQQIKAFEYSIKKRITIDEEYVDKDVSARKKTLMQRPSMNKLIKEIEAGVVGSIIVYKRDRLARKLQEHMQLYRLFQEHNIDVYFSSDSEVQMNYSPIGEYIEAIFGSICESEGSLIAQRIQETKIAKFLSGKYAGNLPYGYEYGEPNANGQVNILQVSREIEIVKGIYDALLNKECNSMQELCNDLNEKYKTEANRAWDQSKVVSIVENPTYYGLRVMNFGSKEYKKAYQNIKVVGKTDWDIANEKLEQIKVNRETGKETIQFLLENILYCHECQKTLTAKKRMKNYQDYYVYECKEHDVCVEARYIEEEILKHAKIFFYRLLNENFDELYQRSKYQNIQKIKKLIGNQEIVIKNAMKKVGKLIDQWLNCQKMKREHEENKCAKCQSNRHRDEIKESNEALKSEKRKLQHLQMRLHEIKNFKEKAKEWLTHLECPKDILILEKEDRKHFYRDMIQSIQVDPWEYHIVFKHPFMLIQEVHQSSETV